MPLNAALIACSLMCVVGHPEPRKGGLPFFPSVLEVPGKAPDSIHSVGLEWVVNPQEQMASLDGGSLERSVGTVNEIHCFFFSSERLNET